MVTLTLPKFNEIPKVFTSGGRNIYILVEGWRRNCWNCGAAGHLAKLYTGRNPAPQAQTTTDQPKSEVQQKASSGPGEWAEVMRREAKVATPPLQQDAPEKEATKQQAKQQQEKQQQKKQQLKNPSEKLQQQKQPSSSCWSRSCLKNNSSLKSNSSILRSTSKIYRSWTSTWSWRKCFSCDPPH